VRRRAQKVVDQLIRHKLQDCYVRLDRVAIASAGQRPRAGHATEAARKTLKALAERATTVLGGKPKVYLAHQPQFRLVKKG
jgi:uncharacterized protein